MNYSRKAFLKFTSGIAGSILLSPGLQSLLAAENGKLKFFGLQLYTIRDIFEKDPKGAIQHIAGLGYKQLEGYERAPGLFWGMKNTEFKKYVEDLGMSFISSHCDTEKNFEQKAAEAGEIGMKYLVYNWEGPNKTIEDYKKLAEYFNQRGAICQKNGLRFAFHNYAFSLKRIDGQYPQDILLNHTDPALVDFQMEIYWFATLGIDPLPWLEKYPNRFRLAHIKDRVKASRQPEDTCDLGTGSIDYRNILKVAKKSGMNYFIVEQEHYPGSDPLKSAEANARFMRKLRI